MHCLSVGFNVQNPRLYDMEFMTLLGEVVKCFGNRFLVVVADPFQFSHLTTIYDIVIISEFYVHYGLHSHHLC